MWYEKRRKIKKFKVDWCNFLILLDLKVEIRRPLAEFEFNLTCFGRKNLEQEWISVDCSSVHLEIADLVSSGCGATLSWAESQIKILKLKKNRKRFRIKTKFRISLPINRFTFILELAFHFKIDFP